MEGSSGLRNQVFTLFAPVCLDNAPPINSRKIPSFDKFESNGDYFVFQLTDRVLTKFKFYGLWSYLECLTYRAICVAAMQLTLPPGIRRNSLAN